MPHIAQYDFDSSPARIEQLDLIDRCASCPTRPSEVPASGRVLVNLHLVWRQLLAWLQQRLALLTQPHLN